MVDRVLRARQVRRRVPLVALLCVVALLVAACGDDDGGEAEPGATTTAAGGDTTTTAAGATKASGEPIVIGMINQEDTPAGSFPEIREAAQAAVEYVNQELGGVGGRPLALEVCATVGTPESAAQCANELVEKGVLLVAGGLDYGTEASLPVLEQAGIPYIGGVPLLMPEFRSPVSFQFQGAARLPSRPRPCTWPTW
ncbi:MAG: ABC transporter substrate-binding protein [Acidimicrobiia bacterium]|nr:ABC transporter substrate-binding protein [Acidimicrobiia bacterium]